MQEVLGEIAKIGYLEFMATTIARAWRRWQSRQGSKHRKVELKHDGVRRVPEQMRDVHSAPLLVFCSSNVLSQYNKEFCVIRLCFT